MPAEEAKRRDGGAIAWHAPVATYRFRGHVKSKALLLYRQFAGLMSKKDTRQPDSGRTALIIWVPRNNMNEGAVEETLREPYAKAPAA